MDGFWFFVLVVWVIVEVIQFFRKVPFPKRMIAPLVSTMCVGGLIGVGSAPHGNSGQDAIRFAISALMVGAFSAMFYGFRILLSRVWSRNGSSTDEAVENNQPTKSVPIWTKVLLSAVIVVAGIATTALSVAGFFYYQERQAQAARNAERASLQLLEDAVTVTAFLPNSGCSESYPYGYQIENKSTKVVDRVDFDILIRKVGFSKVLNSVDVYPAFSSDKVLKPGESWAICFRANVAGYPYAIGDVKDKDVEFEVSRKTVKFKSS